ncbi:hypothetical protein K7X08_032023 [Anisodus acutangulus]|uniref:Uncharacterized protein n=1 Tax=Anisodus acutangulus TaxID=402998 RepID=A0A9Q1RNA2_9SOLA|nr:hypothetical protein K7X08_032023 [Anisodus acutangulus]
MLLRANCPRSSRRILLLSLPVRFLLWLIMKFDKIVIHFPLCSNTENPFTSCKLELLYIAQQFVEFLYRILYEEISVRWSEDLVDYGGQHVNFRSETRGYIDMFLRLAHSLQEYPLALECLKEETPISIIIYPLIQD